jgi:hypothetical protein
MASPNQILRGQLDAFSEAWKKPHDQAMEYWELKEVLRLSLALYDATVAVDRHWSDSVRSGAAPFSRDKGLEIQQLYRNWLRPTQAISRDLTRLEQAGYVVEEAARFRAACKDALLTAETDLDAILEGERDISEGRGIPLQEVRDGLRRRRLAAGQ